ncbi:hypothetical protein HCN44_004891 [Aphidius gifuensis]|uniref:Uncharacterized protein n=1 Tax=Aphidius gifuensis TaxID=684658 RepID=A0A834XU48_APHGI|nr:hypothetical protein HCN44_004891 [Aphidius gifuensis]
MSPFMDKDNGDGINGNDDNHELQIQDGPQQVQRQQKKLVNNINNNNKNNNNHEDLIEQYEPEQIQDVQDHQQDEPQRQAVGQQRPKQHDRAGARPREHPGQRQANWIDEMLPGEDNEDQLYGPANEGEMNGL